MPKLEGRIARQDPAFRDLVANQTVAEQIIADVLTHPVRMVNWQKTVRYIQCYRAGECGSSEQPGSFQTFLEASKASR